MAVSEHTWFRGRLWHVLWAAGFLVVTVATATVRITNFLHEQTDAIRDLTRSVNQMRGDEVDRASLSAWIQDVNIILDQHVADVQRAIRTGDRIKSVRLPDISKYPPKQSRHEVPPADLPDPPVLGEPSRRRLIADRERSISSY